VRFVKPSQNMYKISSIEKAITNQTKILVTSYVQFCTGFKQDLIRLGRICRKKNITFVVNATQGAGILPIDVKKARIDYLTFSGYKWTLSGHGIGVIYINPEKLKTIRFPNAGWNSVDNPYSWNNKNTKMRHETSIVELGNYHFPNILALGSAVRFIQSIGIDVIQKRIYDLSAHLMKHLQDLQLEIISPIKQEYRSGITIVKINKPKKVVENLRKKKIIISARGEGIRICVHIYNNEKDIDKLISALKVLV